MTTSSIYMGKKDKKKKGLGKAKTEAKAAKKAEKASKKVRGGDGEVCNTQHVPFLPKYY